MSTINVSNLILTLQQKIDSSTNEDNILYYSKAIQQLKTGNVFIVNNVSELPNFQQNLGLLYYVRNDEFVYFSTSFGWREIYGGAARAIFSWGQNNALALGFTDIGITACSPVREFCSAIDWCCIASGGGARHAAALKTSGQLWAWGSGTSGELGNGIGIAAGTAANRGSPVREICSATDWCEVSAGGYATAAIKTSGQLWVWGCNNCGKIGNGTTVNLCSPVREICSATDWCQVSTGFYATAAVKTSGQLWVWGRNNFGNLGDGTTISKCSPVRELCSATDWCQVSSGRLHTVAIKTSGQLWSWGNNVGGRLGDGTTILKCSPVREFCSATDWCQVSGGNSVTTTAIKTSGQLWTWGTNTCGGLGDGTGTSRCSPVREFCSATDWSHVSAGTCHMAAVKTSGQLWSWGHNGCGRLGDGTVTDRCSPVREISSATDWSQATAGHYFTTAMRARST